MGAVIITGARRPHHTQDLGLTYFTNERRIVIHYDGVDNRKQNNTLGAGVVWVNPQHTMNEGNSLGYTFQSLNSGGTIAVAGSMAPGRYADILANDVFGNALVTKENPNFEVIEASLATGTTANTLKMYTLLRITFPAFPCSLVIASI